MLIKVDPAKIQAVANTKRIEELKALLASTDYKVLPDYDKPSTEVAVLRQLWRDELRSLSTT
jgi:hypothetical protein